MFGISIVIATVVVVSSTALRDSPRALFSQFKEKYSKIYPTAQEEEERFVVFQNNLAYADTLNLHGGGAKFGVTVFADLSPAEFDSKYLIPKSLRGQHPFVDAASHQPTKLPPVPMGSNPGCNLDHCDWREVGAVTPVKGQGDCSSCFAFSVTEALESAWFLANNSLTELSPQQIVSCDNNLPDNGCNGGYPYNAWDYITKAGGLETDAEYPYTSGVRGDRGDCKFNASLAVAKTSGFAWAIPKCNDSVCKTQDEAKMAAAIATHGPVSVCVDARAWHLYQGGIFNGSHIICDSSRYQQNHCVSVVGYNTNSDGISYWLVRNSWDEVWGEKGYMYVQMGLNVCGIADMVTLPVLA